MKKLFSFSSIFFLFFLTGFLTAVSAFILQNLFSLKSTDSSVFILFFFVFLEEMLKLFFWTNSVQLFFPKPSLNNKKIFLFSLFFAGGFWFLEMSFLKMKLTAWPPFFASGILFLIHWLTSWLVANSNQKLFQKKYFFFFFFFSLSLALHFAYNWLLASNLF